MSRFLLLPAAKADLRDIRRYTLHQWGASQAERYLEQLLAACADISTHPRIGKRIPAWEDEVRIHHHRHHLLVYLVTETSVIFIAFLHERMDIMQRLSARISSLRTSS